MAQGKYWCFTSFRCPEVLERLTSLTSDTREGRSLIRATRVAYLVAQKEVCPDTGKEHIQGYVEFTSNQRKSAVQRTIGDATLHVERRLGTAAEASEYCKKARSAVQGSDGLTLEWGCMSKPEQGKRTDWDVLREGLTEGRGIRWAAEEHTGLFVRYHGGVRALSEVLQESNTQREVTTHVLWGDTGSGKTRAVFEVDPDVFVVHADGKWWDGYHGQKTILFDDFYGEIRYSTMLRLLDRYPMRLQVKGGTVNARWTDVWITSNKPPSEWYPQEQTIAALERRLETVTKVHVPRRVAHKTWDWTRPMSERILEPAGEVVDEDAEE